MASPPLSFEALLDDSLWLPELETADMDAQSGDASDLDQVEAEAAPAKKKTRLSNSKSIDSADEAKVTVTRPKRRRRKGTHTLRKEEKVRLLKEMAVLHSQMEDLKARALKSCNRDATETFVANRVLRSLIQSQQIDLARVHGLMSEYFLFNTQAGSPTHYYIHLKRDENERHDTLQAMRDKVIADARSYLDSRFPRMDALKPIREEHCFEAPNGDYCSHVSMVEQLEGATSVREVYDSLVAHICNIEISISERLGSITIREDDDDRNVSGLMQNRLVSTTPSTGLLMESNFIYFTRCEEVKGEDGEMRMEGMIVCDFVDEDDLHPYDPVHRVRRDVNAVTQIWSYPRPRSQSEIDGEEDEFEDVVVLKLWVSLRLHYPSFKVSSSGWRELRDCSERWHQIVRNGFHYGSNRQQPLVDIELM